MNGSYSLVIAHQPSVNTFTQAFILKMQSPEGIDCYIKQVNLSDTSWSQYNITRGYNASFLRPVLT